MHQDAGRPVIMYLALQIIAATFLSTVFALPMKPPPPDLLPKFSDFNINAFNEAWNSNLNHPPDPKSLPPPPDLLADHCRSTPPRSKRRSRAKRKECPFCQTTECKGKILYRPTCVTKEKESLLFSTHQWEEEKRAYAYKRDNRGDDAVIKHPAARCCRKCGGTECAGRQKGVFYCDSDCTSCSLRDCPGRLTFQMSSPCTETKLRRNHDELEGYH